MQKNKECSIMPASSNPQREYPSTYIVQDRASQEELTRLQIQDELATTSMGGVLPEQTEPEGFRRVLDVGCGPGGWLIETAKTYPTLSLLIGVDVNKKVLDYARARAEVEQINDRVEFHEMDALQILAFPAGYFDLVNLRAGVSWLRTWDWPNLLREFQRVTRPGGVIRLTESNMIIDESSSPALIRLNQVFVAALCQAGHLFSPDKDGILGHLPRLLYQQGIQNVQTRTYTMSYRAGTPEGQDFQENMKRAFRMGLPFMKKWTNVPDNYEEIYQQMLQEMQDPDFVTQFHLLTAWGTTP
jgi:ubiquinone/menaquinone biosynthesis C-methylase UbiE